MAYHWATAILVASQWLGAQVIDWFPRGAWRVDARLLLAMVTIGVFLTWTRGYSIFNLFSIRAFDPGNHALADQVQDIHGTIDWVIVGLAGLHAVAALIHRFVWHDGVLARMLPASSR